MNQLCRVCGEPAAGFHFGAFTCEGCKSFFGRTYSNLSSISECKNNGECVINKKNRTSCKACRLRKCLMVGMSKSGSRYGRRSNWFKIHCLLQEQQQQQHHQHQQHPQHQQQSHGLQEKSKPIALWDGQRFHDKRHHMDIDNNNKTASPLLPVRTLPPSTLPGYTTDTAAALWAARSSLLPLQMSPHHHLSPSTLPPLPVPFLTPPFLHGGGFHPYSAQAPKGFLLPFVQSLPPQKHPEKVMTAASSSSSSTSSSSSSSPLRERKEEVVAKPDIKFRPEDESVCFEKLRNLGPVQEQPIDLSIRGNCHFKVKDRRKSSGKSSSGNSDNEEDEEDDLGSDRSSEGGSSVGKADRQAMEDSLEDGSKHRTTPLDLTTRT